MKLKRYTIVIDKFNKNLMEGNKWKTESGDILKTFSIGQWVL